MTVATEPTLSPLAIDHDCPMCGRNAKVRVRRQTLGGEVYDYYCSRCYMQAAISYAKPYKRLPESERPTLYWDGTYLRKVYWDGRRRKAG